MKNGGKIENSNKSGIYQLSITRYKNELFLDKRKGLSYMKEEWPNGLRRKASKLLVVSSNSPWPFFSFDSIVKFSPNFQGK